MSTEAATAADRFGHLEDASERSAVHVDADARLRAMFDQNYEFIWRCVSGLGVPGEAVDDATQEIFVVASRKLVDIKPGSERSFLFGTALRVASDARRAHARRSDGRVDASAVDEVADGAPGPEELLIQKRARELLDNVIRSLPMELRAVFVLFELEGMPTPEIATCVGIPVGTVASRLRRAREQFHAEVKRLRARATSGRGGA